MSETVKTDYDVVVVGSGPAGISTAMHIAQRMPDMGDRLLVIEKARHPRTKLCGGGITPDADKWLDRLGIPQSGETMKLQKTRMVFQDREVTVPSFRTVCREEFDAGLARAAAKTGILIAPNEPVVSFHVAGDRVIVHTNTRTLTTRVLVGADGVSSLVRRQLCQQSDAPYPRTLCRTLRLLTRVRRIDSAEHQERAAVLDFAHTFERGIQGYAWSFPFEVGGEPWLNLGVADFQFSGDAGGSLIPPLAAFLAERGLSLDRTDLESHPIRWFHPAALLSAERVLLVGDAAGIDPLLADGISFSLGYGDVAAAAIARALETRDFSFSSYKHELLNHETGKLLIQRLELARQLYVYGRLDLLVSFLSPPPDASPDHSEKAQEHRIWKMARALLQRIGWS